MYKLFAVLEKNIRDGNEKIAMKSLKDIIDNEFRCRVSISKLLVDPIEIVVNVFDAEMQRPLNLNIHCDWNNTFLDVKRKICGELSGISPYQQKLFICKGTSDDMIYEFPMNNELLRSHFPNLEDFKLNPISVYITKFVPNLIFEDNVDNPDNICKWTCTFCSCMNNNDVINCIACSGMR